MSINNFKYVGVYRTDGALVIDSRNIISQGFAEKQARDVLADVKNEPWKEFGPTSSRS